MGFSYNPAAQITTATRSNDAYAYTARTNGNTADTINGLNQVTATGGTSIAYDARGNLDTVGGATAYYYTSANRLYYTASGAFILYDAGGVPVNLTNASSVSTRLDMVGAQTLITEFDATQTVTRRYVHGPGQDEPLVWYEGSGTTDRRWLHADERGSVIAISNDSGTVTNVNSYDEYGVPASGNVGRFGYTGQLWMPDLSMWYYRARIYNPTLGRFMQTDPIGYAGGINLYAYVGGDPVNGTDPSGLATDPSPCKVNPKPCAPIIPPGDTKVDPNEPEPDATVTGCRGDGIRIGGFCYWLSDLPGLLAGLNPFQSPRDGLRDALDDLFDRTSRRLRNLMCSIPPIAVTVGADAFLGAGASGSVGGPFDLRTGQFRGIATSSVGAGYGGGVGVSIGPGNESGVARTWDGTVAFGGGSGTLSTPTGSSVSGGSIGTSVVPSVRFGPRLGMWGTHTITATTRPTPRLYNAC